MADYTANKRWADKTDKQNVQMWLPRETVRALDELAEARKEADPITGKARKIGRASVVTSLVEEGTKIWQDVLDITDGMVELEEGMRAAAENEAAGYISDLSDRDSEIETLTRQLEAQAVTLKETQKELERTRMLHGDAATEKRLLESEEAYKTVARRNQILRGVVERLVPDAKERATLEREAEAEVDAG